jgi:hypothetical protein
MPGGIDDIDLMVLPETGGGSRRDGDSSILFLLHPVHRGFSIVHFPNAMALAGVVEDTLGSSSLSGIDVGHDANIPET